MHATGHQHQWGVDTASMHHSRPLSSAPRLPQKCAASFFRPGLQSHFPSLQQRQRQQQQEHRFAARKSCFNFRTEHCKPCSQRCFTVLAASKTPEGEVSGKEGLANNGGCLTFLATCQTRLDHAASICTSFGKEAVSRYLRHTNGHS